jgi:hypothetical protein
MGTWETRISEELWQKMKDLGLTSSERLVLIAICHFVDEKGEGARPSMRRLGAMTALSKRTIQRILVGLEKEKLISRRQELGIGVTYHVTGDVMSLVTPWHRCHCVTGDSMSPDHSLKGFKDLKENMIGRHHDTGDTMTPPFSKPQIKNLSEKEIETQIELLQKRYNNKEHRQLRAAIEVIKSLHNEKEWTNSLRLGILWELEKYPPDLVAESCKAYMDKKDREPSMREDYLISIVKKKAKNREAQQIKEDRKNFINPNTHWMEPGNERVWPRRDIEFQAEKIREQIRDGIKTNDDMVDTLKICGRDRPDWDTRTQPDDP